MVLVLRQTTWSRNKIWCDVFFGKLCASAAGKFLIIILRVDITEGWWKAIVFIQTSSWEMLNSLSAVIFHYHASYGHNDSNPCPLSWQLHMQCEGQFISWRLSTIEHKRFCHKKSFDMKYASLLSGKKNSSTEKKRRPLDGVISRNN